MSKKKSATTASTATIATTTAPAATAPAKAKTATKVTKPVSTTRSKKDIARSIYEAAVASGTAIVRKDVLAQFQKDAGLSASGAQTYFQQMKSGKTGWSGRTAAAPRRHAEAATGTATA